MDTTAEKLRLVLNTKNDIKAALLEKGLPASDTFSTYADKIRAIGITASHDGAGNVSITMTGVSGISVG